MLNSAYKNNNTAYSNISNFTKYKFSDRIEENLKKPFTWKNLEKSVFNADLHVLLVGLLFLRKKILIFPKFNAFLAKMELRKFAISSMMANRIIAKY